MSVLLLFVVVVFVVMVGTKEDEAIVLYYDVSDSVDEEKVISDGSADGEKPAEVLSQQQPTVSVTVRGEALNSQSKDKRSRTVESRPEESIDELRAVVKEKDPVTVQSRAQATYDSILSGEVKL